MPMKTIFDLCQPREEVLLGSLSEDIFAARLKDVMDGTGESVYSDPRLFFENTYPTSGLKTLITDALGRLVGDASGKNAIIRLETAFGGGKTHNLIALYHIASGKAPEDAVTKITGKRLAVIKPGDIKIAGVVGSDLDPTIGISHPEDKLNTFTLWGELAYQLGGRTGYALVQESDLKKVAPGTGLFETLVGDHPTLIMLDEISRHLRAAMGVSLETGKTTLADQTIAFLMSLLEFAASKERCLVVLTLAGGADAFAAETEELRQKLTEALQITARQERVLTPTTNDEVYPIVTHRLFKTVDRAGAKPTLETYAKYYAELVEKNTDLPQRCLRAEYVQEMEATYPFHPELLNTLSLKTATIPNFNQTRGALRLLAWTIRSLWEGKSTETWLIHPHHLDLGNQKIAEDLTSRLDRPKFKQVIEADIVGEFAHAQELDKPLLAASKPPYNRRLGTTIFLHSLTQGTASGVDPADLMLAVIEPEDDPAVINRCLEKLADEAWYLEYDGHRYRFKTEPSINKIISDETLQVGPTKAKAELEGRIRQIWKKGFLDTKYFPIEAVNVDDDAAAPKLAIIHFDAAQANVSDDGLPDLVRKIYEYSGTQESFRKFQNNVLFLVADEEQTENMVNVARRYLAIGRIVGDAERMQTFAKEQKEKLKAARDTAELDVRVAITKAYRYLYYPTIDAAKADSYLRRESLPAQEQGDVDKDQTNVVLRVLRSLNKVLTADDETLPAAYVKAKAWDLNQASISTEDLRKAFARKIGLRMLLDIGQLKKTIQNGVKTGVWIYYDAAEEYGYDHESPPPAWKISDDTILYLPAEASKLGIHIKGKWKSEGPGTTDEPLCPVCGHPESECICGIVDGPHGRPSKLTGDGAVTQAFQQIADQCLEFKIARLKRIFIKIEGTGRQIAGAARSLGLAIPQFGKGHFAVEMSTIAAYGQGETGETFRQEFRGGWERYKRLKSVVEPFLQEADELKVMMRVGCEYERGLEPVSQQFETMRDVLATLDMGKIAIEAIPATEKEG
jgi:hypothetical protein